MSHVLFQCLDCKKDLSTSNPLVVTQLAFWPGSISNMNYVFDPKFFSHWGLYQKESPGSSERSLQNNFLLEREGYRLGLDICLFASVLWTRHSITQYQMKRVFEILCDNGSLCLSNITGLR